jgi:dTDP-4-amino-4,6-dideoxygalactose transaminase
MMEIPIAKPLIGQEEIIAVSEVLRSGWLVQGSRVLEFERGICEFTGSPYSCAASSCTTALHMALVSLDIGPGDGVIVPSFTYVASANAIEHTGAKPIFVDIDLKTFNLDPDQVERCLNNRANKKMKIKCIMPVHLFGLCADMVAISELAKQYSLLVIEDAACAIGSLLGDRHAGTFGDIGCYSFHPRKLITTGEGGMLVTVQKDIDIKLRSLRDHGASISDFARHKGHGSLLPEFNILGYNYRMTDIQAAIGIEQLKKIDYIVSQRKKIADTYNRELDPLSMLSIPWTPMGYTHTYQSYVLLIGGEQLTFMGNGNIDKWQNVRDAIMFKLSERGIATRQGTSAVHTLGFYTKKYGYQAGDFSKSLLAERLSISLPIYAGMSEHEQQYVIDSVAEVIKEVNL